MLAFLAWGVDPLTAVGYTRPLGAVLTLKTFFFTPEVDKIGFDKTILAFWLVFYFVAAFSILI